MYELVVQRSFSAAHCLRNYDGPCARLHGHNYQVEVSFVGRELGTGDMLVDFGVLKQLCDRVLGEMDHQLLNDLPAFANRNPTSECIAQHIYQRLTELLDAPGLQVGYVRVWETPGQSALYRED